MDAITLEEVPRFLPKTDERVWLTPEQAARYLGLPSVRALYQAVRRAQIPAHRFGRRLRFSRDELDRVLRGEVASQARTSAGHPEVKRR